MLRVRVPLAALLVACAVLLSSCTAQAPACSSYVSPGDTATLTADIAAASPGDTICLGAGTYTTTTNLEVDHSGTPSAPITISGYNGVATIKYAGPTTDGGVLQTSYCRPWCASHDIVIENLTLDGGGTMDAGVFVRVGSHNITVRNNMIQNTGAAGVAMNATDHATVAYNWISHAGYNQGWSSGISLWYGGTTPAYGGASAAYDSAPGFHNLLVGNVISGTYDGSHHTDGNGIIVDGSDAIPPALIANNLVYENGGAGIEVYHNSGDVWVVNNTAYADGLDPLVDGGLSSDFVATAATHAHFHNDLAYGRGGTARTFSASGGSLSDYAGDLAWNGSDSGLPSAAIPHADPLLAAVPPVAAGPTPWASAPAPGTIGNSFTLLTGSPARGTGAGTAGMTADEIQSAQPYLTTDINGATRTTNDVGAYAG